MCLSEERDYTGALTPIEEVSVARFTLYGSPHSLPTYKVALMLRLSQQPFSFRYVSFQKGMHKAPEFKALSRWGQVPVLLEGERVFVQSAAIVEHLADTLASFQGHDTATRQAVREWMYWDVDALYPPIWNCYGVQLGQKKLLPIRVDPVIAEYHRRRAETALSAIDANLSHGNYLCGTTPTIADIFCYSDIAFAEICEFDLKRWSNVAAWGTRVTGLKGFKAPFDLLAMQDLEVL
jgi:glutathione S-transferase